MAKLFLLRHPQSQWNKDNRFTGWVDNPLSKDGILQAKEIAQKLAGINIDVIYTSPLIRNQETVLRILEGLGNKYPLFKHFSGRMKKWGNFQGNGSYIPVYVSEDLNERYYGKLQGLNKDEVKAEYGEEQVRLWRRSYNVAPPKGESLKDVYNRAVPFYQKYIEKDLKQQKNVLLVASHNSLRAIVKYLEGISDENIAKVELAFGALLEYEFDSDLSLGSKKHFI
jgi:2,3-bisphosphoglycerate-dependent phosphoglycerate mutase